MNEKLTKNILLVAPRNRVWRTRWRSRGGGRFPHLLSSCPSDAVCAGEDRKLRPQNKGERGRERERKRAMQRGTERGGETETETEIGTGTRVEVELQAEAKWHRERQRGTQSGREAERQA